MGFVFGVGYAVGDEEEHVARLEGDFQDRIDRFFDDAEDGTAGGELADDAGLVGDDARFLPGVDIEKGAGLGVEEAEEEGSEHTSVAVHVGDVVVG